MSCLDLDSILLLVSQRLILYMLLKFLTFFKFLDLGSLRHHLLTKHYSTFSIFFFSQLLSGSGSDSRNVIVLKKLILKKYKCYVFLRPLIPTLRPALADKPAVLPVVS